MCLRFFFKQTTAYDMRISDWSSDVCSSDLHRRFAAGIALGKTVDHRRAEALLVVEHVMGNVDLLGDTAGVVDVASGAAGAAAMHGRTVVVELQQIGRASCRERVCQYV